MTPLEIEIVLHYYTSCDDYRNGDFSAPAVREAIERFKSENILGITGGGTSCYALTERGNVFVDGLCSLGLPEQRWVMPGADK